MPMPAYPHALRRDILEPENNVALIGSGSGFAQARAGVPGVRRYARDIARRSIEIAADICIYTDKSGNRGSDRRMTLLEEDRFDLTPRQIVEYLDRYIVGQKRHKIRGHRPAEQNPEDRPPEDIAREVAPKIF